MFLSYKYMDLLPPILPDGAMSRPPKPPMLFMLSMPPKPPPPPVKPSVKVNYDS